MRESVIVGGGDGPRNRRRSKFAALAAGPAGELLLILICLVVYLPGLVSLPPVDRDESRFVQASRQMAESGDRGAWVVPMVQDRPRLNKPPLIYWLQAGSARLFGGAAEASSQPPTPVEWERAAKVWPYRIPSVLAAVIAVLATLRMGRTMFDPRAGWLGALLLAVSPLMIWESKQARSDMVLLAATTVSMGLVWSLYRGAGEPNDRGAGRRRRRGGWLKALLLWIALAVGVMTKGPITPMVLALTVLTIAILSRRWRWIWRLRPVLGLLFVAAVMGAWVWAVADRVGWDAYLKIVSDEVFGRSVSAKEGHWGPPGYHTVLLAVLLWPGSLLTATAVGRACRRGLRWDGRRQGGENETKRGLFQRWRGRGAGRRAELFCLAWILPSWIVFELVGTKLPHYTLPLYPAIALLSARGVLAAAARSLTAVEKTGCKAGFVVWLLIGFALTVSIPLGLWWAAGRVEEHWLLWWSLAAGLAGLGSLLWAVRGLRKRRFTAVQLAGVLGLALSWPIVIGLVLPRLKEVWVSREVQRVLAAADPGAKRPVAAIGYHEDSLIFLTHGRLRRIEPRELAGWMEKNPDGLVVLPADGSSPGLRRLDQVSGFNYSKGKRVQLLICDRAP